MPSPGTRALPSHAQNRPNTYCCRSNNGCKVVKFGEGCGVVAVKVVVDGSFDDANWVAWLLVQVDADLLEDRVSDVVKGMVSNHVCSA